MPRVLRRRWGRSIRVIAIIQAFNEERFIAGCIEHLRKQGVDVYLIDDASTDDTVAIAERYLGKGVLEIEQLPPHEVHDWREICRHKERLAERLDADWLMHHDADEIRISSTRRQSLVQALQELDEAGYNAVNFQEFTFIPTLEQPDHDHPHFERTMRSYYAFAPFQPHRLNTFKRQGGPVELAWSGGHQVRFEGLKAAPASLYMRHYQFLSRDHAIRKYIRHRPFAAHTVAAGWHSFRLSLRAEMIRLPSSRALLRYRGDHRLDGSAPRRTHVLDDLVAVMKNLEAARAAASPNRSMPTSASTVPSGARRALDC
jgi:glycosyltransferase involved in cell wall biosynthesis